MSYSKLGLLNAILPHDVGVEVRGCDLAYGKDKRQALDIYGPAKTEALLPVLLFCYGGSWKGGHKEDYSFVMQAFASQGFVTVVADYRVVPKIEYPAFLDDISDALLWIFRNIANYGGDPKQVHISGHSAGAYNAAMVALDRRYVARRNADMTLKSVVGLSGPYDFLPLDVPTTRRVFGKAADLLATQPITHVSRDAPPMFLATGASDRLVYPRNTVALSAKLRAAGVRVEERSYRGVGHAGLLLALSRSFRFRAPVLLESVRFMRGIRGFETEGIPAKKLSFQGFTTGQPVATTRPHN